MTNKEIEQKAIEKAIINGFNGFGHKDSLLVWNESTKNYWYNRKTEDEEGESYISEYPFCPDLFTLIFSHKFAKAFWGEELKRQADGEFNGDDDYCIPEWQYHLQQMVILENPIQYLAQFLQGENL